MSTKGELLIALMGYLVVVSIIGITALIRTKSVADFTIGGRSLNWFTTALSTHASGMSGWLLLGLPGMIYVSGITSMWILPGLLIGALCAWLFISRRLRIGSQSYADDAITLPQFFIVRTGSARLSMRLVPAFVVMIFYAIYLASGFIAGAKLVEAVLGWPYLTSLFIGMFIIMIYVALGGFLASSWTDTFQAVLMISALVAVVILATFQTDQLNVSFEPEINTASIVSIVSLLSWGLGYLGQPHILARFMAIKDPDQLPIARNLGLSWMLICCTAAALIGLFGADILPELDDPEKIYIRLAEMLLNPWIAGCVIAAILAAIMSTVDSQLIVASAAITQDLGIGKNKGVLANRITVILLSLFATFIAMDPHSVLDVVAIAWAGLGASFGPSLLACLYWSKTSDIGIVAAMIVGSVVTLAWDFVAVGIFAQVYEILPAFILSAITLVVVSLLAPSEIAQSRAIGKFTLSDEAA